MGSVSETTPVSSSPAVALSGAVAHESFELTSAALVDIDELWIYIAEDSVDVADRVSGAILGACALLAERSLATG